MKLTTRGRFAVNAMFDLAVNTNNDIPIRLEDISERQNISKPYLEQLFNKLRRNGLVKSLRGPGGGYVLARKANEINIAEIVHAVEDSMDASRCGGERNCLNGKSCPAHHLWQNVSIVTHQYLSSVSLADMCNLPDCSAYFQVAFKKMNHKDTQR